MPPLMGADMSCTGVELIEVILFSVQGPIAYYVLISVQGGLNCQECMHLFINPLSYTITRSSTLLV